MLVVVVVEVLVDGVVVVVVVVDEELVEVEVAGVVVVLWVVPGVVAAVSTQFLGRATKPLSKPIKRMAPKPDTIPMISIGLDIPTVFDMSAPINSLFINW